MLDLKFIVENPEFVAEAMRRRGSPEASRIARLVEMDKNHRLTITELQAMQARRNEITPLIGQAMKAGDKDTADRLKAEMVQLKKDIDVHTALERDGAKNIQTWLAQIPNIPAADVPDGLEERDNVEFRRWGDIPTFDFQPKDHVELGVPLGMDFESAAKMSGSRFVILTGDLARLERALGQFMLDLHTDNHGYTEVLPPLLVNSDAMFGTGQLPKFADDLFKTEEEDRWLIPTAEVSLTNIVRDSILEPIGDLPKRLVALTPCFRAEAGAAGRDTRGLIRQHQFNKVELVTICTEVQALLLELERMVGCVERVMQALRLPYRLVTLCAGDMGFSATKTIDMEVWLPGQNAYREISSMSYFGDFQGRRMNARYRPEGEKKGTKFVHTFNGSGVAVGRALVAVIENYQNADGTITVPEVLRPYMRGLEKIEPVERTDWAELDRVIEESGKL